jgi:hypothetical protein
MTGAQEPLTLNNLWGGAAPAAVAPLLCAGPRIGAPSPTQPPSQSPRRGKICPLARHAATSSPP